MSYRILFKALFVILALAANATVWSFTWNDRQIAKTERAVAAVNDQTGQIAQEEVQKDLATGLICGACCLALLMSFYLLFVSEVNHLLAWIAEKRRASTAALLLIACSMTGCYRPREPFDLQEIHPYEVAFVIPLTGDAEKQAQSSNEAWYKKNLVHMQQVKIPYQWVPRGYEMLAPNGDWKVAAMMIRVSTSPVTREWTADPTTGTGSKNEAVWVMTSDQVEFSTGWTITARVADKDGAVKFLANYPSGAADNTGTTGSLQKILDNEVRGKLQSTFGLEVTDLPMDDLRKNATPHINKVVKEVKDFFTEKGITITNLGISGGFVYKDPSIMRKLVELFNAEQEKAIAIAKKNAQDENNKTVISEAQGKADAILKTRKAEADAAILKAQGEAEAVLKTKKAEADGIKLVAEARLFELEKASANLDAYVKINQIQLQTKLLSQWDGKYPQSFTAIGDGKASPNMLLQLPPLGK